METNKKMWVGPNRFLTVSDSPGKVTEFLIVENIIRMLMNHYDEDDEELPSHESLERQAWHLYGQNQERLDNMANLGQELVETTEEELEFDSPDLTWDEFEMWELPTYWARGGE